MEKQIMIDIPEGKKEILETDKDGNITIKFVDIEPVRSKSLEEFCKNHPEVTGDWYIDPFGKVFQYGGYTRKSKCLLKNLKDAEGVLALIQLTRLYDEWVGDWKPSKDDGSEVICGFDYDNEYDICTQRALNRHSLSIFPNSDIAQEFLDCFEDLINKAKRFI